MNKRVFPVIMVAAVILIAGCIRDTYDMNKLSKEAHLTPSFVIAAANGDVAFSDIVKAGDTVVFDQNKLVKLVFHEDNVVNLNAFDFAKGIKTTATIAPTTYSLDISDALKHISGDAKFYSPSITFNYTNSFRDSLKVTLNAKGTRNNKSVNLTLAPFNLAIPSATAANVTASYVIDKSNSNLPDFISLLPEEVVFSGSAVRTPTGAIPNGTEQLKASVEIVIPLDISLNNLQFADTIDNFLKDDNGNSQVSAEDIKMVSLKIMAENGFPMGASVQMSLYDPATKKVLSTVTSNDLLTAAPVDGTGKSSGTASSTATIDITDTFFSKINKADQMIVSFTLLTTGEGAKEVKIYSDYRISFTAALKVKPDINLNNK